MRRLRRIDVEEIHVYSDGPQSGKVKVSGKSCYFLLNGDEPVPGTKDTDLRYDVFPVSEEEWETIERMPFLGGERATEYFAELSMLHREITNRKIIGWFFDADITWPNEKPQDEVEGRWEPEGDEG